MFRVPMALERRQFDALRLWSRREDKPMAEAVRLAIDWFIVQQDKADHQKSDDVCI